MRRVTARPMIPGLAQYFITSIAAHRLYRLGNGYLNGPGCGADGGTSGELAFVHLYKRKTPLKMGQFAIMDIGAVPGESSTIRLRLVTGFKDWYEKQSGNW
jgi:hypothetical protein